MKKITTPFILIGAFISALASPTLFAEVRERTESIKGWEFFFGASFPASRAYSKKDAHYSFTLGHAWDVDVAFLEIQANHINRISGAPGQHYTSLTLGGNYIFFDDPIWALFGGANLGMGFAKVAGSDMKGGFHIGGDVGALFLRDADVNLDIRLRLAYNTAEIGDSHPMFIGILAGIHF